MESTGESMTIIAIYLMGGVANYFLLRWVIKQLGNGYTKYDRGKNFLACTLSWVAVIATALWALETITSDEEARW